ncbi:hypothetical protein [Streptosporangium sp. NPDC000509]
MTSGGTALPVQPVPPYASGLFIGTAPARHPSEPVTRQDPARPLT